MKPKWATFLFPKDTLDDFDKIINNEEISKSEKKYQLNIKFRDSTNWEERKKLKKFINELNEETEFLFD